MLKKRIEVEKKKLEELNHALAMKDRSKVRLEKVNNFDLTIKQEDYRSLNRLVNTKEEFLIQNKKYISSKLAQDNV